MLLLGLLGLLFTDWMVTRHKFASNVVEKSIAFGSPDQKREIVRVVTTARPDGNPPLQILMRDQYGNYVIRT